MTCKIDKLILNYDNIFFTSDEHFDHKNIIASCNRPFLSIEEMNITMIKNWNNVVGKNDLVFVLGDFCWTQESRWIKILTQLNGTKILIRGNHDKRRYIPENEFYLVYDGFLNIQIDTQLITICHYPMLSWYQSHRGAWQLFGHWHSTTVGVNDKCIPESIEELTEYVKIEKQQYSKITKRQHDVGVDGNNFTPISFEQLNQIINGKI